MHDFLLPGSAGELLLYQDSLRSGSVQCFVVSLTMGIDGDVLRQAVNDLMPRFSHLSVGAVTADGSIRLSHIDAKVPVNEVSGRDRCRTPENFSAGDYLFRLSFCGKTVFFDWHSALCDERGMSEFVKAVVFRYLCLSGYPVSNDGSVNEPDDHAGRLEGIDPYERLEDFPASRPVWYMDAKAFAVPSGAGSESGRENVFQLRIPLSKVRGQVRQYLSQPEAFISPLFSSVLHEKYGSYIGAGEYIVSYIRENLRPHFPTASIRPFFAPLTLAYNRRIPEYPFNTILMSQKKLMDAQLRLDALAYSANRLVSMTDKVCDDSLTLQQKVSEAERMIGRVASTATFLICNAGNPVMPESLQQYIVDFYPVVPSGIFAYSMSVICFKGELVVTLSGKETDRSVPFRFAELLNMQGIYSFVSDEFGYIPLKYSPQTL